MKRHFRTAILASVVILASALALSFSPLLVPAAVAASINLQTLPEPPVAVGGQVESSSCVAGPVCVSLGWNHHGNTGFYWAERWQNNKWSKLPAPLNGDPAGAGAPTISCASSTWCMATGSTGLNPGNHPIADELIGTSWKSLSVPTPRGSTDFSLYKLNCQSSKWCIGVGIYVANKPNYLDATFLVSEVWNGSTWKIVPIFSPRTYVHQIDPGMVAGGAHPTASPQQLSCVTKAFCVIAGFWNGVFVEQWNGHQWSEVTAPNYSARPRYDSEFSGGTCVWKTFCVATGGYAVSNKAWRPLIEKWNGLAWQIVALPTLPKKFQQGTGFRLSQVECASSILCVAYGDPGFASTGLNGLKWNGKTWSYISTGSRTRPALMCLARNSCELID